MDAAFFSSRHDHILVYAKDQSKFKVKRQPLSLNDLPSHYDKVDPSGNPYYLKPLRAMGQADKREDRPTMYFPLVAPDGTEIFPKRQDGTDGRWRWGVQKIDQEKWRIDWSKGRNGWTPYFRVYADSSSGRPPETIWFHSEVGSNRTSKAEIKKVIPTISAFDTPKPEALIKKILEIATDNGDLVLDSFAGSGTTGAVAQKMGRQWIMVELGDHCRTHIVPRMKKVIDGKDLGGITKSVSWQGGGGFRYLSLAPSLLKKDTWGNWVINKYYNPEMLAEAMCKHMNFTYAPSQTQYWNHGYSTETDHIYVTTGSLAYEQLKVLSEEVGTERTLLICCKAFMTEGADFPNLTLVKIPRAILSKCEWDQDDYSFTLNVLSDSEQPDDIDYDEDTEDEE